jgi:hypothetical protein
LTRTRLQPGQAFSPNHKICGFYPPDIVARSPRLTDGQKRLYERAVRWAGKNSTIWYSFAAIAKALGKSPRQIKRDMAALEKFGLITHLRRGKRQSNIYTFLYHPMFDGEVTPAAPHRQSEVPYSPGEGTSVSPGEVTPAAHESYKENYVKESSSGISADRSADSEVREKSDDDHSVFHGERSQNLELLDQSASGFGGGNGDPLLGTGPLPLAFLEKAAASLHASRCASPLGPNLSAHPPPDLDFTGQIVEHWRGKGTLALFDWLWTTVERNLGRKCRTGGPKTYGLFLTDSKASAANWNPNKPASRHVTCAIADQKNALERRIKEEQHRQLMETPVALEWATRTLDSEVPKWRQTGRSRFIWLMEHSAEPITPAALLSASEEWRKCLSCKDAGLIGSTVLGTLRFCACKIGQQERLDRGESYLSGEVRRVNATLRSRLLQACGELGHDFTGDSIKAEETKIIEHEDRIVICPRKDLAICCNEKDLSLALKYLSDRRTVRVVKRSL